MIEIIIACAVMAIIFSAVMMLVFSNRSLGTDTTLSTQALSLAQTELARMRQGALKNFDAATSSSKTAGLYTLQTTVANVDTVTKKITSAVSWMNTGRPLHLSLATLITNRAPSDACTLDSRDWSHPHPHEFPTNSLIPGSSTGFSITDIAARDKKLYLAANTTANGATFFIFEIPNSPTETPVFLGSVDNAPTIGSAGINAASLYGEYAFVASAVASNFSTCSVGTNCAQLQTISITDPAHPAVIANIKVPGVTGTGGQAIGWSIAYTQGYVYVGLKKTSTGPEFNIFDVGANSGTPAHPVWLGGYPVGRTINNIHVAGNYAYLATDNSSSELTILDTSDKSHPTLAGVFDAPGTANFGLGYTIGIFGETGYFGRSYVGNAPEFYTLDSSNAHVSSILGSLDIGTPASPDSINALLVRSPLAFLLTNLQLKILNVTNPAAITTLATSTLRGPGSALTCFGSALYAAESIGSNQDILSVITSS